MDNGSNDLLTSLLSNPESLKMLMGIAKNFLNTPQNNASATSSGLQNNSENAQATLIPEKAQTEEIIEASVLTPNTHNSFDERTNLIKSIKPYLAPSRRQKADSLIKAMNVAKIISNYTGNNGFNI